MMDNLRAASNHIVLKIILSLIILSFVLTNMSGYLTEENDHFIANVNGQKISRAQLEHAFRNERAYQQQILGDKFSQLASNENYMHQIRQQVLSELIDEQLLNKYAKDIGIVISDDQIKQIIFNNRAFQNNNKFDNARYVGTINSSGFTTEQYAAELRKHLILQQLVTSITETDFVLGNEADSLAALVAQQRLVRVATINVDTLTAKQSITPEEINSYYQQNKMQFMVPEKFRVSYVKLDAASMQQAVSYSDAQSWYDQHQLDYTQPQRYRYSIIQTKNETDARSLLVALKKGADFSTLAREKSSDSISARKGGDMGWLEADTIPDELKNINLKEKGELSGVIKFSGGFIIARLDDIKKEKIKPFSKVSEDIMAKVKQEKAMDAYYKLQNKVSNAAINDNESLSNVEQLTGMKAVETNWFDRDNVPKELNFKAIEDAIFSRKLIGSNGGPGSNSDIITVDSNRSFVLRISGHKLEMPKPLIEVTSQITSALKQQKAQHEAKAQADKLLVELKVGKGDEVMKAEGLFFGAQQTLSRTSQDILHQVVFTLPLPSSNHSSYGVSEDAQGNVVVIALDKVLNGILPETQKQAMVQDIMRNNAHLAFAALLRNLHKEAKIKYIATE